MALPERIVANLADGLEQLNAVVPGVANDETLLYAPEIKFFATQIDTTPQLETAVAGMLASRPPTTPQKRRQPAIGLVSRRAEIYRRDL